jgi:hypothetical protein
LIAAFLQTVPPEVRSQVHKAILRNNTQIDVSKQNPDGQRILDQIYASRDKRMSGDPWKQQ